LPFVRGVRAKGGVYVKTEVGVARSKDAANASEEIWPRQSGVGITFKFAPGISIAVAGPVPVRLMRRLGPVAVTEFFAPGDPLFAPP
jgi:hypothetical protein